MQRKARKSKDSLFLLHFCLHTVQGGDHERFLLRIFLHLFSYVQPSLSYRGNHVARKLYNCHEVVDRITTLAAVATTAAGGSADCISDADMAPGCALKKTPVRSIP